MYRPSPYKKTFSSANNLKELFQNTEINNLISPLEDFYGAFQKLLERYNKCIAAGGDYFKGD